MAGINAMVKAVFVVGLVMAAWGFVKTEGATPWNQQVYTVTYPYIPYPYPYPYQPGYAFHSYIPHVATVVNPWATPHSYPGYATFQYSYIPHEMTVVNPCATPQAHTVVAPTPCSSTVDHTMTAPSPCASLQFPTCAADGKGTASADQTPKS